MKKTIFFFILISNLLFGQNSSEFEFNSNNQMNDFIVVEIPKQNKNQIYNKTIDWIKKNYDDPESVLITKINDEYLRFKGYKYSNIKYDTGIFIHNADIIYEFSIDFKDFKYKVTIEKLIMVDSEDNSKYKMILPLKEKYTDQGVNVNAEFLPFTLNEILNSLKEYILNEKTNDW